MGLAFDIAVPRAETASKGEGFLNSKRLSCNAIDGTTISDLERGAVLMFGCSRIPGMESNGV
ncbi:hypothetical protein [Mycolicibacterium komossense]|uniref:Uncharacterized protein n=1 Tax=Mycolicibacterium komossense TaxID=1779 RepID=A0ABT3CLZ9_9MYCO|nr:hypothetical protein [Mycolicibacterium komossense]MCV7230470.1 hypothetical protein [Mycolicibacterium komossense]